jgi:carbamate kinase
MLVVAAGLMRPKVLAARDFVQQTDGTAAMGRLKDAAAIIAGTCIAAGP